MLIYGGVGRNFEEIKAGSVLNVPFCYVRG